MSVGSGDAASEKGFRITSLRAWTSIDPEDGDEGIAAFMEGNVWIPMVAADEERLRALYPMVERLAAATGRPFWLREFTSTGEPLGVVMPP